MDTKGTWSNSLTGRKLVQTVAGPAPAAPPRQEGELAPHLSPDVARSLAACFLNEDREGDGQVDRRVFFHGAESKAVRDHAPPPRGAPRREGEPIVAADFAHDGGIELAPCGGEPVVQEHDEAQQLNAAPLEPGAPVEAAGPAGLPPGVVLPDDMEWEPQPDGDLEAGWGPPVAEGAAQEPLQPPTRLAAAGQALAIGLPNMLRVLASEGLGVVAGAYALSSATEQNSADGGTGPSIPILMSSAALGALAAMQLSGVERLSSRLTALVVGGFLGGGTAQILAAYETAQALNLDTDLSMSVFKGCVLQAIAIPIAESVYQALDRFVPKGKLVVSAAADPHQPGGQPGGAPLSSLLTTGASSTAAHVVTGAGLYGAGGVLTSAVEAMAKQAGIPALTAKTVASQAPQVLGRALAALYEAVIAAKAAHDQGLQLQLVTGPLRSFCSSWKQMAQMTGARLLMAASPHQFLTIGATAAAQGDAMGAQGVLLLRAITDQLSQFAGAAVERGHRRDDKLDERAGGEPTPLHEFLEAHDLFFGGSVSGWTALPARR